MQDLGDAAVGGFTLENNLRRQSSQQAAQATAATSAGMAERLDRILQAIEKGQVIALDGRQLVGGTATLYDNAMGRRQVLAARGAI